MTAAVSVIICAYTLDRWDDLARAVASVLSQQPPPAELLLVVDHNDELLDRARKRWVDVRVMASRGKRGLSGARNSGVEASRSEVVAFLDDDAAAEAGWLAALVAPYDDPLVAACGGSATAALVGTRPPWWPIEFDWVIGCSYLGLPRQTAPVRNLIGANMSVRRALVVELGGFPEGIGRVGARPMGCEETDLFIRLRQRWPDSQILYEPSAAVRHSVPEARLSWRYFRSRCFAEGLSKALVAERVGSDRALASERTYALKVLPVGVVNGLRGAFRGEPGAALRAMAIAAGLAITTAGYARGRVSSRIPSMKARST